MTVGDGIAALPTVDLLKARKGVRNDSLPVTARRTKSDVAVSPFNGEIASLRSQ